MAEGRTKGKLAVAASLVLLAACGGREPATDANEAVGAEAGALEDAAPPDSGQPKGADRPSDDPAPPPDAVSHPDGYLPDSGDVAAPSAPEPTSVNSSTSTEPPPATEDEYIRNRQTGG
jgi:hypothetical protein